MNGIIHNCTHNDSDGPTARMTEDKMFIAIPSTDKTFTCTLFAPAATFDYLNTHSDEASILSFFQHHFPASPPT